MSCTTFFVAGIPKAQPRVKATIRGKHAGVYDPGTANGWKKLVALAYLKQHFRTTRKGAVRLSLEFNFARPKSHYRTGKNKEILAVSSPIAHTQRPDLDNLIKSTTDQLTNSGAWLDDAQICSIHVIKRWASPIYPEGCQITIEE